MADERGSERKRPGQRQLDPTNPSSISARSRSRRAALLRELIARVAEKRSRCLILDLGGSRRYWNVVGLDFLRERGAKVHIVNIEPERGPKSDDGLFSFEVGDARNLPHLADGAFDLCHSNSVIEHVGLWDDMHAFARETRRLSASYFVQTPNFWFPVEPHFAFVAFHWLPEPVRVSLLRRFKLGWGGKRKELDRAIRATQRIHLVDRVMLAELFPDARIVPERYFGLTKSLMAIREDGAA
jgi:hypothetical protein